jgi:acetyl esterase
MTLLSSEKSSPTSSQTSSHKTEAATKLDPVIAEFERRWKESGIPGLYEGSGPEMRERARNVRALLYPKPKLAAGKLENFTLPGPVGDIAARAIWPAAGLAPSATLIYFHGGGFIVGDIDSHEAHCIRIANHTGAVVVSIDYRLAPEAPFPAGIDDALVATRWIHAQRARFAGVARPLAVGGDSAGGNLAAVAAVMCRDEGIPLAVQFLLYPATDMRGNGHGPVGIAYLGSGPQALARSLDPRASPVLTATLTGVAPAIIGVGVYDFLYQDNLAYAKALKAAGVATVLREFATLNHGFFSYTGISTDSCAAADSLCDDLRAALLSSP